MCDSYSQYFLPFRLPSSSTQIATIIFASQQKKSLGGFARFSSAPTVDASTRHWRSRRPIASNVPLKRIAGTGFLILGGWSIAPYYRGT